MASIGLWQALGVPLWLQQLLVPPLLEEMNQIPHLQQGSRGDCMGLTIAAGHQALHVSAIASLICSWVILALCDAGVLFR